MKKFPLIKLAKKLKVGRRELLQPLWNSQFPLIKLAKKLKDQTKNAIQSLSEGFH